MNPPLTQAQALTQLQILTSQTANFTFNVDELTQALQTAWNDPFTVRRVWDSSLSYTQGTWQYTLPATITVVRDLYYQKTSTQEPEILSTDLYEIVAGVIQFKPAVQRWMLTGMTIYIKGVYKLVSTDTLNTTHLVNYVLYTAAENLLETLIFKSVFVFLRNDTSMADITRALQLVQSKRLEYKRSLSREFESV